MSKLIIWLWIHHSMRRPMHVDSISWCLIRSNSTVGAHYRIPIAHGSMSTRQLGQVRHKSIIMHIWRLERLHIERCQVQVLSVRNIPDIPAPIIQLNLLVVFMFQYNYINHKSTYWLNQIIPIYNQMSDSNKNLFFKALHTIKPPIIESPMHFI